MIVKDMPDAHHPIRLAARPTGLTTHVIRIWEQRYQAVEPERTPSNHRLYSQRDIERLSLLRDVTRAGHSIGQMARLSNDELRALVANASGLEPQASRSAATTPAPDTLWRTWFNSVWRWTVSANPEERSNDETVLRPQH